MVCVWGGGCSNGWCTNGGCTNGGGGGGVYYCYFVIHYSPMSKACNIECLCLIPSLHEIFKLVVSQNRYYL